MDRIFFTSSRHHFQREITLVSVTREPTETSQPRPLKMPIASRRVRRFVYGTSPTAEFDGVIDHDVTTDVKRRRGTKKEISRRSSLRRGRRTPERSRKRKEKADVKNMERTQDKARQERMNGRRLVRALLSRAPDGRRRRATSPTVRDRLERLQQGRFPDNSDVDVNKRRWDASTTTIARSAIQKARLARETREQREKVGQRRTRRPRNGHIQTDAHRSRRELKRWYEKKWSPPQDRVVIESFRLRTSERKRTVKTPSGRRRVIHNRGPLRRA